jgi:hypothetical protein
VKKLHYLSLYLESEKPIKTVICHLTKDTSAEDTSIRLVDLVFHFISVKQMTFTRTSPEGHHTITLTLFLITLDVFKLTSLCCNIIKIEAHKPQMALCSATTGNSSATSGLIADSSHTLSGVEAANYTGISWKTRGNSPSSMCSFRNSSLSF